MPSTMTESLIFRDMFGTPGMRAVFSDEALVGHDLYVEDELKIVDKLLNNDFITQIITYDKMDL